MEGDFGSTNFPEAPKPELGEFGFGFPPLILMPMELLAAGSLAVPEALPEVLAAAAPPVPLSLPSGETATRAARFPFGTSTIGAGGAGAADRAITVVDWPPELVAPATSGAGAISPFCFRSATRGAEPAFSSTR